MRYISICLFISLNFVVNEPASGTQVAADAALEFSATAIQKAPEKPDYRSQMYIGKDSVRTDSILNNVDVIEIVRTKDNVRLFLVPEHKVYMEVKTNHPDPPAVEVTETTKPCDGLENTSCLLLGLETIFGRSAEKWEFTVLADDQKFRSLHWIDVERRMIVREFLPNGTISELIPQGNETINGRQSEKWLWQVSGAEGPIRTSLQWYDPELKITTREEIEGGYVRELRMIKIEKQPASLFKIPKDFNKVNDLQQYLGTFNDQSQPGQ